MLKMIYQLDVLKINATKIYINIKNVSLLNKRLNKFSLVFISGWTI